MNIQEGLKAGDLEGIVEKQFTVDQFKSKMGEDKDVCVLSFTCNSQNGAKDLETFAEKGYKTILDADATPGTMEDGKYKVFIEFPRDEKLAPAITEFLNDLKKLTNKFKFSKTKLIYYDSIGYFLSIGSKLITKNYLNNFEKKIKIWDTLMPISKIVDLIIFNLIGKSLIMICIK